MRGEDEKNATDAINNLWFEGATVADLTRITAARRRPPARAPRH
jgi:hypothetical protein